MKSQDKAKPISFHVKLHPDVLRLAKALGVFYDNSDVDHIVAEAIKDAAKDRTFAEWLEQHPTADAAQEETTEVRPRRRTRVSRAA